MRLAPALLLRHLLCLLLLSGSAISNAQTLSVGVYQNEPKIFSKANGEAAGIEIEILQAIAKAEGWQLKYVPCQWQECLRRTAQGEIDLLPDVAFSEQRKASLDFHRTPALRSWSQLYRHANAAITSPLDLHGKRIAVLGASIQEKHFARMLEDLGVEAKLIATGSLEQAFTLVQAGQADAAIANRYFGQYHAQRFSLQDTAIIFQPAQLYYASARGRHNHILERIEYHLSLWHKQAGSPYYQILQRWSSPPTNGRIPPALWWGLALLCTALLLALGLSLILRWQVKLRTRHLHAAQMQLEATLNAIPDLLFEVDAEGRIYNYHSPRADLLAAPPEAFLGQRFADFVPPEANNTGLAALQEALQLGHSSGRQYSLELPQGLRWFELSVSCKQAGPAAEARFIMLCRDITQRKQHELELQTHLENLTRLNHSLEHTQQQLLQSGKLAAVGQLAAGVAHEINNPISFIKSNLKYLQSSFAELYRAQAGQPESALNPAGLAPQGELLTLLEESIEGSLRIERIVKDLNSFARISAAEWSRCKPESMLDHTLRLIDNDVRYKARIHTHYAGLPEIDCLAPQLDQVFLNLLANAASAITQHGNIHVRTGFDAAQVWIEIEDDGCGIPPEQQARIFEPFFTTRPAGKGTGLGLSIAYGIVQRHHGDISVRSTPGQGSCFRVSLPRSQQAQGGGASS